MMNGYTEKMIKSFCRNKIDDLCKHISKKDKDLACELKSHCFVSGGAITSLLQGDMPNDYDIYIDDLNTLYKLCVYFTNEWNKEHISKKLFEIVKHTPDGKEDDMYNVLDEREYVEIQVRSCGLAEDNDKEQQDEYLPSSEIVKEIDDVKEKHDEKYKVKCITSNAISLSDDIQIVCRFCGNPEEIFKNYDFVHTMQAYVRNDDKLLLNTKSLVSILCKRLEYQGSLFPICSLFRLRKFISRGWTISAVEILKIAYQVSKLNLDDIKTLKEQCLGADFTYLSQFVDALQKWRDDNPDVEFNSEYMFQLIEKVFDKDYSLNGESNETEE